MEVTKIWYLFMLPVANIEVTSEFANTVSIKEDIMIHFKNTDAYSGGFLSQICRMVSVSNIIGTAKRFGINVEAPTELTFIDYINGSNKENGNILFSLKKFTIIVN